MKFKRTSRAIKEKINYPTNLEMLEEAVKNPFNYYDAPDKKLYLGDLIKIEGVKEDGSKVFSEKYSLSEEGKGEPYLFVGFDKGGEIYGFRLYDKPSIYLESNNSLELINRGEEVKFENSRIRKCLETLSKSPLVPSDRKFRRLDNS
jgi:hypothetical protein